MMPIRLMTYADRLRLTATAGDGLDRETHLTRLAWPSPQGSLTPGHPGITVTYCTQTNGRRIGDEVDDD